MDLVEKYNMGDLSQDEILEFQRLVFERKKLDEQILDLRNELRDKCLFGKYWVVLTDDCIIVKYFCESDKYHGVKRIPLEELLKIEEFTHTKLVGIADYQYKFQHNYLDG